MQRYGNGRACAHRADVWRAEVIQLHSSQPQHQIELSFQLYSPNALTQKEQNTVAVISMTCDNSVCKLKRNQQVTLREINAVCGGKHVSVDFMAIRCLLLKCCKQSLQCPVLLKMLNETGFCCTADCMSMMSVAVCIPFLRLSASTFHSEILVSSATRQGKYYIAIFRSYIYVKQTVCIDLGCE